MIAWFVAGALAAEPAACEGAYAAPEAALSVAWVSPLRKTVGNRRWLTLHPTAELRSWAQAHAKGRLAPLLQHVGVRKRDKEPKRRFKVVVFDVRAESLCRPLADRDGGAPVGGVAPCLEGAAQRLSERHDGCGRVLTASGQAGPAVYRARWADVVANGFCVLPLERFAR